MPCLKKLKRGSYLPLNPFSSGTRQSNRFTSLPLLLLSWLSQCHNTEGYSKITFCYNGTEHEDHRLNTTIHKHITAMSEFDCAAHCSKDSCCRSANFRKIPPHDGRENCELLHAVEWEEPENLQENQTYDYLIMIQPKRPFDCKCLPSCKGNGRCQNCQCSPPGFSRNGCEIGKNCRDIKNNGFDEGDGEYMIDPDGGSDDNAFQVYCDMTSFGGGWTMCYTTNNKVDIKREVSSEIAFGINGYRANCNEIPFTEVMFVDGTSNNKSSFVKVGPNITFNDNYDKPANTYGQWNRQGVASLDSIKYQLLICDTSLYKGLHVSGYPTSCFKYCEDWCGDMLSPYFRTAAVTDARYSGVAFDVNGHRALPKRLISVGLRNGNI